MSRREEYNLWIEAYVKSVDGFTRGRCGAATAAMQLAFPELRIAKGFAYSLHEEVDQHFWCVAPDNTVVDPTVSQFPLGVVFEYEELDLNNPADVTRLPIGKCMNCGEQTFTHSPSSITCSVKCETELHAAYSK